MAKSELNWMEVDTDSLKGENKTRYGALKDAQKHAAELRKHFESGFIDGERKADKIDTEETMAFSYRFGKLSVAAKPTETKSTSSNKPKYQAG